MRESTEQLGGTECVAGQDVGGAGANVSRFQRPGDGTGG